MRSLEEVILHALKVGSPPNWENAPDEFQSDLAALDRLEDEALWKVATGHKTEEDIAQHFELLERNKEHTLTPSEQVELVELRSQADFSCYTKPMLPLFYVGVVCSPSLIACVCLDGEY
ncbi:hypothetical protein IQ268_07670 [Oculatella sp. LEGE 06141]|uniref:hypothetical protein n=1 Tax=Oculatella sp. LEGE 06141 TaxID=1828648 RepID=UPI00187F0D78|nr:hypothetical protein [Oculatella sp. LEGE 06141]MBE9178466.1 hypothetical protein [Oculatella sp. LEGE 06141]